MKRQGGVSIIPCKLNGLDLELIFDTGASDVSISMTEATLMLETGKLTKNDINGTSNYLNANGDISEGIVINIKEIEIAGLKLFNVKASVVKNLDAPLLLGQTAISKLGKIQLDLNNNILTILNGKGSYDFSTYSLTDKVEKYYKESSIIKIEKKENKEGLQFSYTIPKKWKEQEITNPEIFKTYISDEYPYGCKIGLIIGISTLSKLYNDHDSCQEYVESINRLVRNVDPSFKVISTSKINLAYCKTIKNIILTKDEEIYRLSFRYWIFIGNRCLNFIYTLYSSDLTQISSIGDEIDKFCFSQASNIFVYNVVENANSCTIKLRSEEKQADVDIILNNACNWVKADKEPEFNLYNLTTAAHLSIVIGKKNYNLVNFDNKKMDDINIFKNNLLREFDDSLEVLKSHVVTISNKSYLYIFAKQKKLENYILAEFYLYVISNRVITLISFLRDRDESKLNLRFRKTQSDLRDLLEQIEFIGEKSLSAIDYFNRGVVKNQASNFKGAIDDFTMAIELSPNSYEAYYNRGVAKAQLLNYESSINDFTKTISLRPLFMDAYLNRGIMKMQQNDCKMAMSDFDKAIEIKPEFADVYFYRGLCKLQLGSKVSGCDDLNKASIKGNTKAREKLKQYCK